MPDAARIGDPITTGHGCDGTSTIKGNLQSKVKIEGIVASVVGDPIEDHTILSGSTCIPHVATVTGKSSKVKFGGKYAARVGDAADAGTITSGSSKVTIG